MINLQIKKAIDSRSLNIGVFLVMLCILPAFYFAAREILCDEKCHSSITYGVLEPFMAASTILLITTGLFVFIPRRIFRTWLIFIVPLSLVVISALAITYNPYPSGFLKYDTRTMFVIRDSIIFAMCSVVFAVSHFVYDKRKAKQLSGK